MSEIFRPQQEKSEETNPVLTGVMVGFSMLDASLNLAEVAIDELSGNDEENIDNYHLIYVPPQQETQRRAYDQWLAKQQDGETQQLASVRSELASFTPSQESANSTPNVNIPDSVPQAPIGIAE